MLFHTLQKKAHAGLAWSTQCGESKGELLEKSLLPKTCTSGDPAIPVLASYPRATSALLCSGPPGILLNAGSESAALERSL